MKECLAVCIPAWNEEATLANTLDSLLLQQLPPRTMMRIFVGANGCTDRTEEIAKFYAQKYASVVSLLTLPKASKANAWNELRAAAQESSRTITFCDGDVVVAHNALASLAARLESERKTLVGAKAVPYVEDLSALNKLIYSMLFPNPDWQKGICGALYMLDNARLSDYFTMKGIIGMPSNIINEDLWLQKTVGSDWATEKCAHVLYRPYALSESIRILARHAQGRMQLGDENCSGSLRPLIAQAVSSYKKAQEANTFAQKMSYIAGAPLRNMLTYLAEREAHTRPPVNGEFHWQVSYASKHPIPLSAMAADANH